MKTEIDGQIISIYIGEDDKWQSGLLYPAIVERLKQLGLSGVTVLNAIEGFGSRHKLHTKRFEVLFESMPVVIEAADSHEKIAEALAVLDEMIKSGLVTVADVKTIRYTEG